MQQTLSQESGTPLDAFGVAAAIDGDTIVVGAPSNDAPGAALVYTRSGGSWSLQAELSASEPAVDDSFGSSVALYGDLVVVGAPFDSTLASAYVFERTGTLWSQALRLEATGRTAGDAFGYSVAANADTVLVGANTDSERGEDAGAAYVFVRDGSSWLQARRLTPWDAGPAERDYFGTAVALTDTTAAVTAMGFGPDDLGSAYAYARIGETTWSDDVMLRAADTARFDRFGASVAIAGDTIAVGAPAHSLDGSASEDGAVYSFRRAAGAWVEELVRPQDSLVGIFFGDSVAIDGDILAVSAALEGTGSVHVFVRESDNWTEAQTLLDSDGLPTLGYETAVSVSGDTIVVGFEESAYYGGQLAVLALGEGVSCSDDAGCASGFCSEGLCCNARCGNLCDSCRADRNTSGTDGACGPVLAATDPRGACAEDANATCGNTGVCDGTGECERHPSGSECGSPSCAGPAEETPAATCNASGVCVQVATRSCGGFLCATGSCLKECTNDSVCDNERGFTCQDGACKLPRGAQCSLADECSDGHCFDGVCCDADCAGACEACTAAVKGSGIDGECGAIAASTDPDDECPNDGPDAPCDADGACDGRRHCRAFAPSATPCGVTSCSGDSIQGWTCNGEGRCEEGIQACAPNRCAGDACSLGCESDDECAAGAFCTSTGSCEVRHENGVACGDARECASDFCVDGLCCSSGCRGQCEACDEDFAPGTCVPVVNAPHGSRSPCGLNVADMPCQELACDGQDREQCRGFVTDNSCDASGCTGDPAPQTGACDGTGECRCPEGPRCSEDGSELVDDDEVIERCAPFRCVAGACRTNCVASTDCQPAFACNPNNRRCEAVQAQTDQTGGCSTSGRSTRPLQALSIIFLGLTVCAGRRALRRRKPQINPSQRSESSR